MLPNQGRTWRGKVHENHLPPAARLGFPPCLFFLRELGVFAVKRLENHLQKHRDGSNGPLRRDQHLGLLIP